MFEVVKVRDTVQIAPSEFGRDLLSAVQDVLLEKFANKVVPKFGLCITLLDVLHVGEAHLHPGHASQQITVDFRLVVFRPYVGEVMTGNVVASDAKGATTDNAFDHIQSYSII